MGYNMKTQPQILKKKHEQILQTSTYLFSRYGIRRISIEEICRTAGVSKMTFYKYFSNKDALIRFILDKLTRTHLDNFQRLMTSDIPFFEKVEKTIQIKLEQSDGLSQEFIDDVLQNTNEEIQRFMQEKLNLGLQMAKDYYSEAQRQGEIRDGVKIEFILYMLKQMREMVGDKRLSAFYSSPRELTAELMNFFFYGILSEKKR